MLVSLCRLVQNTNYRADSAFCALDTGLSLVRCSSRLSRRFEFSVNPFKPLTKLHLLEQLVLRFVIEAWRRKLLCLEDSERLVPLLNELRALFVAEYFLDIVIGEGEAALIENQSGFNWCLLEEIKVFVEIVFFRLLASRASCSPNQWYKIYHKSTYHFLSSNYERPPVRPRRMRSCLCRSRDHKLTSLCSHKDHTPSEPV